MIVAMSVPPVDPAVVDPDEVDRVGVLSGTAGDVAVALVLLVVVEVGGAGRLKDRVLGRPFAEVAAEANAEDSSAEPSTDGVPPTVAAQPAARTRAASAAAVDAVTVARRWVGIG
jgi:hypothetical protein